MTNIRKNFQSFENRGGPEGTKSRVNELRTFLQDNNLDGVIIPRSDPFMNEYITPHDERLLWLTGFSGSNGLAIVMKDKGALFSDGRYVLQAKDQIDESLFTFEELPKSTPFKWLTDNLSTGDRIAICPALHKVKSYEQYKKICEQQSAELVELTSHPVDEIWDERPNLNLKPVYAHPLSLAGQASAEKLKAVQDGLKKDQTDALIITACDSLAWVFNLRGSDVAHTPIALGFALVYPGKKADLFIGSNRCSTKLKNELRPHANLYDLSDLDKALKGLKDKKVQIDPGTCNGHIFLQLEQAGAQIIRKKDPCQLPKAKKNKVEVGGARKAHELDGIAMVKFLAWFDGDGGLDGSGGLKEGKTKETITEISAAQKLESFRQEDKSLKDISFETISGFGSNGAIVHYRVSEATNKPFQAGSLYLVDSGGQYQMGTTDITRTIAIGKPSKAMIRHYTAVLKAHIALSAARFPKGTNGAQLDGICRKPLWELGIDFDHGTGHGVGSFLSVHEGPANISKRGTIPLEEGMILSNEPGYYKEGAYGIRIENLVLVTKDKKQSKDERDMLTFEILTLCPYDRALIDVSLLTHEEVHWVDRYHANVRNQLHDRLDKQTVKWLRDATKKLS